MKNRLAIIAAAAFALLPAAQAATPTAWRRKASA